MQVCSIELWKSKFASQLQSFQTNFYLKKRIKSFTKKVLRQRKKKKSKTLVLLHTEKSHKKCKNGIVYIYYQL